MTLSSLDIVSSTFDSLGAELAMLIGLLLLVFETILCLSCGREADYILYVFNKKVPTGPITAEDNVLC